jgi:hypothetical protein
MMQNDNGNNEHIARERQLQEALESSGLDENKSSKWLHCVFAKSMDVGSEIVQSMIKSPLENADGRCEDLLEKHMLFAGQLLSAAAFAENLANRGAISRFDTAGALQAILHDMSSKKDSDNTASFPAPSSPDLFYSEVLDARERAEKDLEEAITLLNGELELAKLKWSPGTEVR